MILCTIRLRILLLLALAFLAGCENEAVLPPPFALTREASGNYCGMIIVDHPGPKAQVHEKDLTKPLWFSSVLDALVYLKLPGEAQRVIAVYVQDMGSGASWQRPIENVHWIKADEALYVIGSKRRGGMGAREAVPFSKRGEAVAFSKKNGGQIVTYADIPTDYILRRDEDRVTHQPGKVGPES